MRSVTVLLSLCLVACGGSSETGPDPSSGGGGSSGGVGAGGSAGGSGTAGSAGAGGTTSPPTPDPGQIQCALESCNVPANVCCYGSVSPGGVDRCLPKTDCLAPSRGCDEHADCVQGQVCCTGAAVLPTDATVGGFASAFCVDATAPSSCVPKPGVGNSSVMVCKLDADCEDATCVLEDCYGHPLMTCGGSTDCS